MENKTSATLFEYATRNKVRFPYKGVITVEDLWDLPVTALDSIYKTLNSKLENSSQKSLLSTASDEDELTRTQIKIVEYIFSVKSDEANARERERENKVKREKIAEILAARQDESLRNASNEELQKMLDELM